MAKKGRGAKKKKPQKQPPLARKRKRRLRLMVISEDEAKERATLATTGDSLIMKGDGNTVMECGNCGAILIEGVLATQFRGMAFKCSNCGELNASPA